MRIRKDLAVAKLGSPAGVGYAKQGLCPFCGGHGNLVKSQAVDDETHRQYRHCTKCRLYWSQLIDDDQERTVYLHVFPVIGGIREETRRCEYARTWSP